MVALAAASPGAMVENTLATTVPTKVKVMMAKVAVAALLGATCAWSFSRTRRVRAESLKVKVVSSPTAPP